VEIGPEIAVFRAFRRKMAAETMAATVALALAAAALAGTGTALGVALGGVAGAACLWLSAHEVEARASMGVSDALRRTRRGLAIRWALRIAALLCAVAVGRAVLVGACGGLFVAQFVLLFRGGTLPEGAESEK
jgi:hypothetical protein